MHITWKLSCKQRHEGHLFYLFQLRYHRMLLHLESLQLAAQALKLFCTPSLPSFHLFPCPPLFFQLFNPLCLLLFPLFLQLCLTLCLLV